MPPTFYRGCWHVVSRDLFLRYRPHSSLRKGLYNPKAFIAHAALLRQTFVHCAIVLTAASRRSLDRVSVPVWLTILSDQLPVIGLVGHYPTNYLMGRRPLPTRRSFNRQNESPITWSINHRFQWIFPTSGQVTYVLLTHSPLTSSVIRRIQTRFVRLACVRHAASVHPEPGSNSPYTAYTPLL